MRACIVALACAGLAACASAPRRKPVAATPVPPVATAPAPRCAGATYAPAQEDASKRGDYVAGGLYRPGERDRLPTALPDVACIPEPQVVALPRSRLGNKPVYTVLDREYRVLDDTRGFVEEGLASYYGEKFHGRRTSNWEVYDMYAFTAAHKTLPLPSFARVTNLANGRSVVVRVNDRGPFHEGRILDLSLAAAVKLGVHPAGTARVRVEALQPGDAPDPSRFTVDATTAQGSAERFDGWLRERNVRVATGQPTPVPVPAAPAATASPDTAAPVEAPIAVEALPAPVRPPVAAAPPLPTRIADGQVMLQVASFATRDNADRALRLLQRAGIAQAHLQQAAVAGQPVWRLRVGPLAPHAAHDGTLAANLARMGFAPPRPVRE